jgi:mRNA interferase RelE/StbE
LALRFVYTNRAKKELNGVPPADRERIARRVEAYAAEPSSPRHDVRRLVNMSPANRLRVGDWRVLFEIEGDAMTIHRVLHRREAYR